MIDAHQHFWKIARGDYGWLTPELPQLYHDFLPEAFLPIITASGISDSILVQAAPTTAETEYLLTLADAHSFIKGVVGWVDFTSDTAISDLQRFAAHPAFVGVRPMIQDIADDNWMLRATHTPVLNALHTHDLVFEALVLPRHLQNLHTLLSRHPQLRVVIDHGAKPPIRDGNIDTWAQDIALLARETGALCKLSGLVTEAQPNWTVADLKPCVDHLLECFGSDRIIWGSDWPVCTLASSYPHWLATTTQLIAQLPPEQREAIMGGNAASTYRLRTDHERANGRA